MDEQNEIRQLKETLAGWRERHLVRGHRSRAGTRPAGRTGDADLVQDGDESRAVGDLSRREHESQRQPGGVDRGMDFAA
ncbi:hypothetical protein GCM10018965_044390 [Nonomuraea roseola]